MMWNFKIKGFLTLTFLCSIANTEKILDPEEHYYPINGSIYDRLINSAATPTEKEIVMGSLKSILAHIPDPSNWTSLTEVIREGKLEENIEKLGGEKSKSAVYFLQRVLRSSMNKTALTSFLDACLELVCMENISKTEKMLIMADFLTPSEYNTWYKGSAKLAEVMGVKKVFIFPQNQIDFLVKYWNETPILNESILSEKLEKLSKIIQERGEIFMENFHWLLKDFKEANYLYGTFYNRYHNWTEFDSYVLFNGIDEIYDDLSDSRFLDFDFKVIETIENNLMENPNFESSLMSQLENDRVKNYFNKIDKKYRADTLVNFKWILIRVFKDFKQSQRDAASKFFKVYTSFKNSTKVSFGNVFTKKAKSYECWDLWKSQSVSEEMERLVELMIMFEKEFRIETCLSNAIDIRDIAQLSKHWNETRFYDRMLPLLSVNQTFKEALRTMLTGTETPSRSSYRHILKTLRKIVREQGGPFYDFISSIRKLHNSDFQPLWMVMKQFFEFTEGQRKEYINIHFADSNSTLAQFFKTMLPTTVDAVEILFVKPKEQWTSKQMEYGVFELVQYIVWLYRDYNLEDQRNLHTVELVDHILDDNISYKDCKMFMEYETKDQLTKHVRYSIFFLNIFGKMSCETEPPKNVD